MTENLLPVIGVAFLLQLVILYFVIKMAITDSLYKTMNRIVELLEKLNSRS
jgi:hypothetical protein